MGAHRVLALSLGEHRKQVGVVTSALCWVDLPRLVGEGVPLISVGVFAFVSWVGLAFSLLGGLPSVVERGCLPFS